MRNIGVDDRSFFYFYLDIKLQTEFEQRKARAPYGEPLPLVSDQNKMAKRGDAEIPKMVNKVERTINWIMVKRNTPHQLPCTGA